MVCVSLCSSLSPFAGFGNENSMCLVRVFCFSAEKADCVPVMNEARKAVAFPVFSTVEDNEARLPIDTQEPKNKAFWEFVCDEIQAVRMCSLFLVALSPPGRVRRGQCVVIPFFLHVLLPLACAANARGSCSSRTRRYFCIL